MIASTTFAFADHENTGLAWTSPNQEFFCHNNLSDLQISETVTDAPCEIIADAVRDWTNVSGSSWQLSASDVPAITFRSSPMGATGLVGLMTPWDIFGTIIHARVRLNSELNFGDSSVDNNVFDIYTIIKHEMGHLPTWNHNSHAGDENISVMRSGSEIRYDVHSNVWNQ